ncbi:acyltransferase [Escherichia coli]|uniref:acyltransferase n=1 Tax=Escherichia coli TaxID=562 RepID=UPI001DF237A8|nr:acyltransferase [Escherichia coli]
MERKYWADFIRFFSIILVVITHCHEKSGVNDVATSSIFYTVDRLGVPLFLMISGGFVLPKLANIDPLSFYKKRIPQFIVLLVFYAILTNFIVQFIASGDVLLSITNSITKFNGIYPSSYGGASQLWYLYTITQLYLIAPFLAAMLKALSNKSIILFLIICIFFNYFVITIKIFEPSADLASITRMGKDFTGAFLVYFILGYLIVDRGFLEIKSNVGLCIQLLILIIVSSFPVTYDIFTGKVNNYLHWYSTSVFILIASVPLFNILKYTTINLKSKFIINDIAKCSFGIFLLHYAVLYIVKYYVDMLGLSPLMNVFAYFIPTFLATYLIVKVMEKSKITKYFAF